MTRPAKSPDRKRGRGRPPVPAAERTDQLVQVRLTRGEMLAVQQATEADGARSLSAWVRDAVRERLGL